MTFTLLERFSMGKWADADRCEDVIHRSDAFVAVIDGATSTVDKPGKTPGRLMAELIDEALHTAPADAPFDDALRHINRRVREHLGYRDDRDILGRGARPAAAAMILSQARQEVWCVGDGWLMCDGKPVRLEIVFAEAYTYLRCAYVHAQLRAGVPIDDLLASTADWELIRPFLELQPGFQNNPEAERYAFGVIDGCDGCLEHAQVFDVSGSSEVVLASDGYPIIGPTLAASEQKLAEAIERDPLMIDAYPQCKPVRPGQISFDDRSYVRFKRILRGP